MKEFITTFIACLVICSVATFFFAGLIFSNIWAITIVTAFFLAVLITVFMSQETRIEVLEKKVEQLLNERKD